MSETATADPLDARRVPYDVDKHKLVEPVTIEGKTYWIDGTHRRDWHLGVCEPIAADGPASPEALRWCRAGHDPQRVTILDGFRSETPPEAA